MQSGHHHHHLAVCLQITDSGSGAVVEVHKSNFPDAVVWNPWVDKAKSMADFGDEEYKVRELGVLLCLLLVSKSLWLAYSTAYQQLAMPQSHKLSVVCCLAQ